MSKPLYLVKTTFKAGGKVYLAGDLIENLSTIRLFKIRLNEGKLIPLPADKKALDSLQDYFRERYNIDLKKRIAERVSKGSDGAEDKNTGASTTPPGTPGPEKDTTPPKVPEQTANIQAGTTGKPLTPPPNVVPKHIVPKQLAPKQVGSQKPKPLSGTSVNTKK